MEPRELSQALHNGTLGEAATKLESQRAAALQRGDSHAGAVAANDLGVVYYLAGRTDEARKALECSRDEFAGLGDQVGLARASGNLARVEEKCHKPKVALALYHQAVELFHEGNERGDEFATLRSLSQLYLKMGAWLQALATFDRGLTIKPRKTFLDAILHWLYQIPLRMMGLS